MSTQDVNESLNSSEVELEESKDIFDYKKLSLSNDYYSITWASLKKTQYVGAKVRGIEVFLIPSDYFWIYINFISFFVLLLITVILLVRQAFESDKYVESGWLMGAVRIILVALAQKKLFPEFESGYAKLLYSLRNDHEFTHSSFANFVALCQMFIATINLIAIIFFVCMADEFIDPVTNFAGLCVLSELDDWIGDVIAESKPAGAETIPKEEREELSKGHDDHNPNEKAHADDVKEDKYNTKRLNDRLTLSNKLSLITSEDLEIEYDESVFLNTHWSIIYLEKIIKKVPWFIVIPLITIPVGHYMPMITEYIRSAIPSN